MTKNNHHFVYDDNPLSGCSMHFTSWDDLVNHWLPEFKSRKECHDYLSKVARGAILNTHDILIVYAKKLGRLSYQEKQELLAYAELKCDFNDKVEEQMLHVSAMRRNTGKASIWAMPPSRTLGTV